jgi:hypothetical protein
VNSPRSLATILTDPSTHARSYNDEAEALQLRGYVASRRCVPPAPRDGATSNRLTGAKSDRRGQWLLPHGNNTFKNSTLQLSIYHYVHLWSRPAWIAGCGRSG